MVQNLRKSPKGEGIRFQPLIMYPDLSTPEIVMIDTQSREAANMILVGQNFRAQAQTSIVIQRSTKR